MPMRSGPRPSRASCIVSPILGRTGADFVRVEGLFFAAGFFFAAVLRDFAAVRDFAVLRAGARPRAVDARFVERDRLELFDLVATVFATLVDFGNTTHAFRAPSASLHTTSANCYGWGQTLTITRRRENGRRFERSKQTRFVSKSP